MEEGRVSYIILRRDSVLYIYIRDIIYILLFVSPGDKDSTTEINIYIDILKNN